jgi:hypothetical protein
LLPRRKSPHPELTIAPELRERKARGSSSLAEITIKWFVDAI